MMCNLKTLHQYQKHCLYSILIYLENVKDKQLKNIPLILIIFLVSHLDISGKHVNDEQPENSILISMVLLIFYFDISGKAFNK